LNALKFNLPKLDVPQLETKSSMESTKTPFVPPLDVSPPKPQTLVLEKVMESQDVRDQRAREAKLIFDEKDTAAKEIEKKAADARKNADEAKIAYQHAKDDACATRFGGKILCLRWGVGY
jgi:hypothetical protein